MHEYACTYIGLHTQVSYMRMHTASLCAHVESMHTQTCSETIIQNRKHRK